MNATTSAQLGRHGVTETEVAQSQGRVPKLVTLTWAGFQLLLLSYVVAYYVPDLRAWLQLPPP